MKTIQRFDDINALRRYSVDGLTEYPIETIQSDHAWSCDGGSVFIDSDNPYASSHYVLEIAPSSNAPVVISIALDPFLETEDLNSIFVFTGVFYSGQKNISVSARMFSTWDPPTSESGIPVTIQASSWKAVRSNQFTPSTPQGVSPNYYNLEITISNHNTSRIRMSTPNLVNDSAWLANPVINSMRQYIPAFYAEYDALQENPRYPMFRFIDVLTDAIADTMFLYSDWFEYEERELPAGITKSDSRMLSKLTNPSVVREKNRQWLAQFSGAKTRNQIFLMGTEVIPTAKLDEFKEWQLSPAGYGIASGTQESIRDAVKFVLTGPDSEKVVIISQISGGDPWLIKIITLVDQSPTSEEILAAAEPARPMGYVLTHEAVDEINLVLGDPIYGRLGSAVL